MQTVRQIERYWNTQQYDRLVRDLLQVRPEFSQRLLIELSRIVPAAALALIRIDELGSAGHPLNARLIRTILAAQEADGSWGDPLTTAIALRALLLNFGHGDAINRGLAWFSELQKSCGIWPGTGIRRTEEDAFVSAFILFSLGSQPAFVASVRLEHAMAWFQAAARRLDPETRRLWDRAHTRCRMGRLVGIN